MTDTSDDGERLHHLLDRWEAAHKAGRRLSAEALCADDPGLTSVLQEQIDALLEIGSFVDDWEAPARPALPEQIGPYRVLRELSRGGSAVVYLCQQTLPQRQVALKILQPARAVGKLSERFRREIQLLATLHHPGIAQIYDAGIADLGQGPQPYFTMEWIQGQRLNAFVRSRRSEDWSLRDSLELMVKVCEAIELAHENGIIHRDLKPANILVSEAGQPKVLDFGIARIQRRDATASDPTTVTEVMLGTPPYMSPEQFAEGSRAVDARSDVYSLGVILYELLTGRLPYKLEGSSIVQAGRIVRESVPVPAGRIHRPLRGDLETILAKALAKDPDDRYQSVAALSADMRHYLAGEPIAARRIGPLGQLWRWGRANPRSALLGATALASLLLACTVSLYFGTLAKRHAHDLEVSVEGLRRERTRADRQAGLARQHSQDLAAAKSQLEQEVQRLRRSVMNATLMRASDHTASDPLVAASLLLDEDLCPADLRGFAWNLLYRQTQREVGRIQAHDDEVVALDVSADGTTLATAGLDGKLRIWQCDSLKPIASFEADIGGKTRIALDATGNRLLAITAEGKVLLASVAQRQIVKEPHARSARATRVAFSPQGRWLAIGEESGNVRVWETDLSGTARVFKTGSARIVGLRFGAEDRQLVGVARDGVIYEWAVEPGTLDNQDQLPLQRLLHVAIDPSLILQRKVDIA